MVTLSRFISKAKRRLPENHRLVYRNLCLVLSGQPDRVSWSSVSLAGWDLLVTIAQSEGVAPLLYHVLHEAGWPEQIPIDLQRELRAAYYATAAHNALLYRELARVLAALATADHGPLTAALMQGGSGVRSREAEDTLPGLSTSQLSSTRDNTRPSMAGDPSSLVLPVVVLKGAALATTLYPSIAVRPLNDLDLLVPCHYLEAVLRTMRSLGYHEIAPEKSPGLDRAVGYCVHLRGGPRRSVTIDLHWRLIGGDTDWRSPPLGWFWDQTEEWRMENGKGKREQENKETSGSRLPYSLIPFSTYQLAPTAHLLYLAAHLMLQHGGAQARLLWFYDLHLLVSHESDRLDWDELVTRARDFRWAYALRAALQGTQERLGTSLPDGFLDVLAQTQDRRAVRLVERKAGPVQTRAVRVWDRLTSMEWSARLRLVWSIAFPSAAYLRWRYNPRPTWLWPLCYLHRWFDILCDVLSTLWQLVRRPVGDGSDKETR